MPEAGDTIPPGLTCVGCDYDLAGLPWGTPCPECGYRALTTEPTDALREAHPRFIRSALNQLRGLILADVIVLVGLALIASLVVATWLGAPRTGSSRAIASLGTMGFPIVAVGLAYGLVVCGFIGMRHRNARDELDQPTRASISKCFWWCVAPLGISICLTIVTSGAASCLVIITGPVSLACAGGMCSCLFSHANSITVRCGQNPSWSRLQYATAYGSLACLLLTPLTFIGKPIALALLIIGVFALLLLTHALRTRMAERCVCRVLAEIHERPTTEVGRSPAPHRS